MRGLRVNPQVAAPIQVLDKFNRLVIPLVNFLWFGVVCNIWMSGDTTHALSDLGPLTFLIVGVTIYYYILKAPLPKQPEIEEREVTDILISSMGITTWFSDGTARLLQADYLDQETYLEDLGEQAVPRLLSTAMERLQAGETIHLPPRNQRVTILTFLCAAVASTISLPLTLLFSVFGLIEILTRAPRADSISRHGLQMSTGQLIDWGQVSRLTAGAQAFVKVGAGDVYLCDLADRNSFLYVQLVRQLTQLEFDTQFRPLTKRLRLEQAFLLGSPLPRS